MGVGGGEEFLAERGEGDAAVAEFPVAVGGGGDGGAEEAGEELVAEADACEVEVWFADPELYGGS